MQTIEYDAAIGFLGSFGLRTRRLTPGEGWDAVRVNYVKVPVN